MSEDKKVVKRVAKDNDTVVSDKASDMLQNETERVLAPPSEADKIWQEIKDAQIQLFSLPRQTVSMHARAVDIEPNALYLELSSPAAFPALDELLGQVFNVEQADRFIKVSRK